MEPSSYSQWSLPWLWRWLFFCQALFFTIVVSDLWAWSFYCQHFTFPHGFWFTEQVLESKNSCYRHTPSRTQMLIRAGRFVIWTQMFVWFVLPDGVSQVRAIFHKELLAKLDTTPAWSREQEQALTFTGKDNIHFYIYVICFSLLVEAIHLDVFSGFDGDNLVAENKGKEFDWVAT